MKILSTIGQKSIAILFIIVTWQLVVSLEHLPPYLLPGPLLVFHTLINNIHLLLLQTLSTALESILGFILAVGIGMFSALVFSYFPVVRHYLLPSLVISQALPTFAIAPLLVVWLGYGMASKIVTVMIMLFFPVTTTFYDGLVQVDENWLDLAQTMQATRFSVLRYIALPAALPALASGLRLAACYAPMGAVIGEWVGSSQGLGYLMLNANARLQVDMMFAALICLIGLALLLFFSVDRGMKWLIKVR
ncbi:MAG: ABC transporter permease [Gammaproteobacteria bacterium]|nr:ABC transporter permease [Gammaproteobacteria bacterium]